MNKNAEWFKIYHNISNGCYEFAEHNFCGGQPIPFRSNTTAISKLKDMLGDASLACHQHEDEHGILWTFTHASTQEQQHSSCDNNDKVAYKPKMVVDAKSALDVQVGGSHYKNFKIQPAEFCAVNGVQFLEGNVIKYVMRHEFKNGLQDIEKAIHYLELIKQIKYGENK